MAGSHTLDDLRRTNQSDNTANFIQNDGDYESENEDYFTLREDQLFDTGELSYSSNHYVNLNETSLDLSSSEDYGDQESQSSDESSSVNHDEHVHNFQVSNVLHHENNINNNGEDYFETQEPSSNSTSIRDSIVEIDFLDTYPNTLHTQSGEEPLLELLDSEDEEKEEQIRREQEKAVNAANEADERRRHTSLTLDTKNAILEAMKKVNFHELAPDWAKTIPEEEWKLRIKDLRKSQ